ncbi:MAG: TIM barrel protein [Paracoccaceae bacterium]
MTKTHALDHDWATDGPDPAIGPEDLRERALAVLAVNHMTMAKASFAALVAAAGRLGCVGVELRNDLPQPLFDGQSPQQAGEVLRAAGLRLLALAEVKMFNAWSDTRLAEALALMDIAQAAGAEAVSLIPRNDAKGTGEGERQANLRLALRELKPHLEARGLVGLVEPLGFEISSLRSKAEAVDAIEAVGGAGRFKLVHDTFHHALAGGGPIFAAHTGLVHISGVVDPRPGLADMRDPHRVLVDGSDRLDNVGQLRALHDAGYAGPVSVEAFAPAVHDNTDLEGALSRSFHFIEAALAETDA